MFVYGVRGDTSEEEEEEDIMDILQVYSFFSTQKLFFAKLQKRSARHVRHENSVKD